MPLLDTRRDFTINALAVCLNANRFGELVDPFDGLADLEDGIIRTPLDPDVTFSDDPLRMMRCVRFATQLKFYIEDETFDALTRNAERLKIISGERIEEELNKISVGAPKVIDMNAEQYADNNKPYRYNVTVVVTVTSTHVDKVRGIIARQGELLRQGVAVVAGDYDAANNVSYQLTSFKKMKPQMMTEAIENAEQTAQQFAKNRSLGK